MDNDEELRRSKGTQKLYHLGTVEVKKELVKVLHLVVRIFQDQKIDILELIYWNMEIYQKELEEFEN